MCLNVKLHLNRVKLNELLEELQDVDIVMPDFESTENQNLPSTSNNSQNDMNNVRTINLDTSNEVDSDDDNEHFLITSACD